MAQQMATYEQERKLMDEEALGLLEDLRETISNYRVRSSSCSGIVLDVDRGSRWCNKRRSTSKDAKG